MENRNGSVVADGRARQRALGVAIRRARGSMTQQELGDLVGCRQSSVSAWENGAADLLLERVHRLETSLRLRPGALLRDAGYVVDDEMPSSRHHGRS